MTEGNGSALPVIPARPLTASEGVGATWVTPELRAERRADVAPFIDPANGSAYRGGLDEMVAKGLAIIEPQGARVLVRALIPEDFADSALWQPEYDARSAIMYKVLAVGPGCARWWKKQGYTPEQYLKPGDFTHILTTVADRLSSRNKTVRQWTVKAKYIAGRVVIVKPAG